MRSTTHVGEVDAGQIAKAANQVIVGLTIGAVAEALALAKRAGADPAKVREALLGGFAASRILEVHGRRMIDGAFTPGGKATTQRKDLQQALDLASSIDLDLPATALTRDLYDRTHRGRRRRSRPQRPLHGHRRLTGRRLCCENAVRPEGRAGFRHRTGTASRTCRTDGSAQAGNDARDRRCGGRGRDEQSATPAGSRRGYP